MLGRTAPSTGTGGAGGMAVGAGDISPTYRVPGASLAARASQEAAKGSGQIASRQAQAPQARSASSGARPVSDGGMGAMGKGTTEGGDRAKPQGDDADAGDDDGFQTVHRRGWRRARARGIHGTDDSAGTARGEGADDDGGGDGEADGDMADGDDGQGPSTPSALHRAWQEEVAVVRRLKQQGIPPGHPAMRTACSVRDEAERTWRNTRDPAPAAVRLARAQAKLDRALELQNESRRALSEYEAAHAERLAALHARLDEDRARINTRRQQLEAIQEEVGAEGQGARVRAR